AQRLAPAVLPRIDEPRRRRIRGPLSKPPPLARPEARRARAALPHRREPRRGRARYVRALPRRALSALRLAWIAHRERARARSPVSAPPRRGARRAREHGGRVRAARDERRASRPLQPRRRRRCLRAEEGRLTIAVSACDGIAVMRRALVLFAFSAGAACSAA